MSVNALRRAVGSLLSGHLPSGESDEGDGTVRSVSIDELATEVTAHVAGSTDDAALRESVGLFLERSVAAQRGGSAVELDETTGTVRVADGNIVLRDDRFPVDGWSWRGYYAAVAVAGIYCLLLCRLGGPAAALLNPGGVVLLTSVLLLIGSVFQRYADRERVLV